MNQIVCCFYLYVFKRTCRERIFFSQCNILKTVFENRFYKPNNYSSSILFVVFIYFFSKEHAEKWLFTPVIYICIYASLRSTRPGLRPSIVTTNFNNQNKTLQLFSHPIKMFLKIQSQRKNLFSQYNILKTVFINQIIIIVEPNNYNSWTK